MGEERTNTSNSCLSSNWLVAFMVFIILKYWSSILFKSCSRIREVGKKAVFQISLQFRFSFIKSLLPENAVESIQSKTWQSEELVDLQCNCYCSAWRFWEISFLLGKSTRQALHCTNELQLLIERVIQQTRTEQLSEGQAGLQKLLCKLKAFFFSSGTLCIKKVLILTDKIKFSIGIMENKIRFSIDYAEVIFVPNQWLTMPKTGLEK